VDQCLADVRRTTGSPRHPTLDALAERIVEAALDATRADEPAPDGQRKVALPAAEHYHRIRKALESHRHRGNEL
jgi:hypothetical protein